MPRSLKEDPRIKCHVGDYPVSTYRVNGCTDHAIELDERHPTHPWMVVDIKNGRFVSGRFPIFATSKAAVDHIEQTSCD